MTQPRQLGDSAKTQQQVTLVGCVQREAEYRQAAGGGRGGTLGTGIGAGNEFVLINATQGTSMASSVGTPASSTSPSPSPTPSDPAATAGTAGTAGTTGSTPSATASGSSGSMAVTSGGKAYALTGNREKDLEQYVGQKVEIVGTLEATTAGASAGATATTGGTSATGTTGGTTAGTASGTTTGTGTASTGSATGTTAGATAGISGSASQRVGDLQQITVVSFRAVGPCNP